MDAILAADPKSRLEIAYVGRLVQEQKQVQLLPILGEELERRGVDYHLHLIGDGPDREGLQQEFINRGRRHNVTFHGWLDRERLSARLRETDLLVLVSSAEGLPIAMLEAMGHGVAPLVADIDCGANSVVTSGSNGLLLPAGDMAAFAEVVESLSRDRRALRGMQRAAWETSRAYTVERMGDAYMELFSALLGPNADRSYRRAPGRFQAMPSCRSRYPLWLRRARSRVKRFAAL
jgi:glycosyltransferase involved in cell wall biosynthesis